MTDGVDPQAEAMRQLAILNRIARIAVEDLARRPMLQRIVDTLAAEFGWEFIACASVDRDRHEFVCEAVAGEGGDVVVGYRRALGTGVVGQCAVSGETIDIDDARSDPIVIDTLMGTGSELCVPVLHNGEVLAVLNVESRQVGAFRGQRPLLETVADQLAGVLRAAALYQQLQDANNELRVAYAEVERLSRNDGLTGVPNRRSFDAWLADAWGAGVATRESLALLMIDIDHFKRYNDSLGHLAGDACLREVAVLLQALLSDVGAQVARYGGEEFAVLLNGARRDDAARVAERLRRAVQARDWSHQQGVAGQVTISIGVAAIEPTPGTRPDVLIALADGSLYEAKRLGRNRVEVASG